MPLVFTEKNHMAFFNTEKSPSFKYGKDALTF